MSKLTVAFLLFPEVTQLDLTGPAQVLSRLGNARIELVAKTRDPVPTDAGFCLLPTATFSEVDSAEILCVPGGVGTLNVIEDEETLVWVRAVAADAAWVPLLVCSTVTEQPAIGPHETSSSCSVQSRFRSGSSSIATASLAAE